MKLSFEKFLAHKAKLKPNTKIKIITGSMEPFIHTGEVVECSPTPYEDLEIGNPIVFWNDNKLICHFLIKKFKKDGKDYFITKGLNARKADKESPSELYFAVVTNPQISNFKRKLFNFLSGFSRSN